MIWMVRCILAGVVATVVGLGYGASNGDAEMEADRALPAALSAALSSTSYLVVPNPAEAHVISARSVLFQGIDCHDTYIAVPHTITTRTDLMNVTVRQRGSENWDFHYLGHRWTDDSLPRRFVFWARNELALAVGGSEFRSSRTLVAIDIPPGCAAPDLDLTLLWERS